jgi:hypothetical protein
VDARATKPSAPAENDARGGGNIDRVPKETLELGLRQMCR